MPSSHCASQPAVRAVANITGTIATGRHRLVEDLRVEVDVRVELPADEVLVLARDRLELERDVEQPVASGHREAGAWWRTRRCCCARRRTNRDRACTRRLGRGSGSESAMAALGSPGSDAGGDHHVEGSRIKASTGPGCSYGRRAMSAVAAVTSTGATACGVVQ